MQTYTIEINEHQRVIIEQALCIRQQCEERDSEENDVLVSLFAALPADEAETPNALHVFCV